MAIVNAHVQAVQQLYVAYFNRPADFGGLDYWTNVVAAANGDTSAVSAQFATSKEYTDVYKDMTSAQIVDKVYQNLFGRPAEEGGKKYWADLLDAKTISIDTVVREVGAAALTTDKEAYENKVAGATAFTAALDTPAEQAGYQGEEALALAKEFISGITTDGTLAVATAPAALAASVAAVVAAGTPFSLNGSLEAYAAAQKAVTDFLDAYDGKADGKVDAEKARDDIDAAVEEAEGAVGELVTTGEYVGASASVQAALLADQVAAYNKDLIAAQKVVTTAQGEVNKVAGLNAAISTLASATAASDAADKSLLNAQADLEAKIAAYNKLNGTSIEFADISEKGELEGVFELDEDGKLVLADDVSEDDNAGVTALLSSVNAELAAVKAADKAQTAEVSAQTNVNYLDQSTAEKTALAELATLVKDAGGKIGTSGQPTLAQITSIQASLQAKADAAGATEADIAKSAAFNEAVDAYNDEIGTNELTQDLTDAKDAVKGIQDKIKALNEATADLTEAKADAAQLEALDAAVTAQEQVFIDNDLTVPAVLGEDALATAGSDVYLVGTTNSTINLFGLVGDDSLYVGKDYVLSTAKPSAGSDAALEIFVAQDGDNTTLTIEQHTYSSHVSNAAAPEIIVITLTGVTSTDVNLNNGIITVDQA